MLTVKKPEPTMGTIQWIAGFEVHPNQKQAERESDGPEESWYEDALRLEALLAEASGLGTSEAKAYSRVP